MSLSSGKVVMIDGYVCGSSSKIVTTAKGEKAIRDFGLEPIVVDLPESGFYKCKINNKTSSLMSISWKKFLCFCKIFEYNIEILDITYKIFIVVK